MQAHAYAWQKLAQEAKGFVTVSGDAAERFAVRWRQHGLTAIVASHFQGIIVCREAVEMAAIRHLYRKAGELVIFAIAPIGLIPSKHLAHRRNGQIVHQLTDPGAGADQQLARTEYAIAGGDLLQIALAANRADRAVKQLRAAGLFR
ncbi:hypothetical protein E05_37190 [Plautia stali symbiont]|nr:hypothetical protein E05_37190 [Plautia stali symbiont]